MTLPELLPEYASQLPEMVVGELRLDSRQINAGDTFVAVNGSAQRGLDFLDGALARGASLVLAEAEGSALSLERAETQTLVVKIPELKQRLSAMAGRYFGNPSDRITVIGITGTNGKTTCCQWLAQLLTALGTESGTIGTLGYGLVGEELTPTGMTTPDAIAVQSMLADLQAAGARSVVMEVSSHGLDQARVNGVPFNLAILTNISRDHLDYHGDMAGYVHAKSQLMKFPSLQSVVVGAGDYSEQFLAASPQQARRILFSANSTSGEQASDQKDSCEQGSDPLTSEKLSLEELSLEKLHFEKKSGRADFYVISAEYHDGGITALIATPEGNRVVEMPVWGAFNLENVLAVIASAWTLGYELDDIIQQVFHLKSVPGRLQLVDTESAIKVIVDFAHTPDALESVLDAVREHVDGKIWCVFGCGGDRDQGKRPQMGGIAERLADHVVVTSDNPRSENPLRIIEDILMGMTRAHVANVIPDRAQAVEFAIEEAEPGDLVLLAGKGHESYQDIAGQRIDYSDVDTARLMLQRRAGGVH